MATITRDLPRTSERRSDWPFVAFVLAIVLSAMGTLFFEVYRSVYFQTISYDSYSRYLLWLMGEPGGAIPPSPHPYRAGAVLLAAPFYDLPLVTFRKLGPEVFVEVLRAQQAICIANIIAVGAGAVTTGLYLRFRSRCSEAWALVGVLAFLVQSRFLGLGSVDGISSFPLTLVVIAALERKILAFGLLMLISTVINEKIVIVGLLFAGVRLLASPRDPACRKLFAIGILASLGFLAIVAAFPVTGLENQKDPGTYIASTIRMLGELASPRGLYLNVFPVLLLATMWLIGATARVEDRLIEPVDGLILAGLLTVALMLGVDYNVGRVVMFCMPLFLLGAIKSLSTRAAASITPAGGSG